MVAMVPDALVFLDETSTPLGLTPLRGPRAIGAIPRGRWTQVTLLATLTAAGFGPSLQFAGTLDRSIFETFLEAILVPQLHPGQVMLDNLSVHQSARARTLSEPGRCLLVVLPTSSPDDTAIEQAFAKLRHALHRIEARTVEAVMTATA
jgi:transposase